MARVWLNVDIAVGVDKLTDASKRVLKVFKKDLELVPENEVLDALSELHDDVHSRVELKGDLIYGQRIVVLHIEILVEA